MKHHFHLFGVKTVQDTWQGIQSLDAATGFPYNFRKLGSSNTYHLLLHFGYQVIEIKRLG